MRVIDIMLKDLSQILRDKKSLLFLLIMPVVFTVFMGMALKGNGTPADPRLAVGWVNQDEGGIVSTKLHDLLVTSDSIRLVDLGSDGAAEGNKQVASGKLAGALIIPGGFSQAALAGRTDSQMILVADPVSVSGQSALQMVQVPVTRVMSAVQIGLVSETGGDNQRAAFETAAQLWQETGSTGPQIIVEKAQGAEKKGLDLAANPFNQSSPGMMVMFAIFGLTTSSMILVQERKTRTLERMMTTSLSRAEIIAGHLLAMVALILAQQVILVVFGQFALKVDYLSQPLGTLLAMIGLSLWVASLGLLIGVLAKAETQVILFSMVAMFIFSALGGAWFPLEGAGHAFSTIGKLTPSSWAMTGFQNLLVRGLDSVSVLLPAAIQLAYTAAFFALAVWRFNQAD